MKYEKIMKEDLIKGLKEWEKRDKTIKYERELMKVIVNSKMFNIVWEGLILKVGDSTGLIELAHDIAQIGKGVKQ